MYSAAGQYDKAIQIIGERGWLDELIEVARTVDKSDTATLKQCAQYFRRHGNHQFAKEVFLKMGDVQSLMKLHVELHKWEDAFILAQQHGGGKCSATPRPPSPRAREEPFSYPVAARLPPRRGPHTALRRASLMFPRSPPIVLPPPHRQVRPGCVPALRRLAR